MRTRYSKEIICDFKSVLKIVFSWVEARWRLPVSAKFRSFFNRLTRHIPSDQIGRYLIVGIWNTAFAYGSFVLFTAVLDNYMPHSYIAASLLTSLLNITVSFLGYKWFVFKTKGNYLREWTRCLMVYSGGIVLGLALLPPTVFAVSYVTGNPRVAPYLAGALLMGMQVILSFLGHKTFSFRSGRGVQPEVTSMTLSPSPRVNQPQVRMNKIAANPKGY